MAGSWIVHQYAPSPYCERLRRVLVQLELPFEVKDYLPVSDEARRELRAFADRVGHNQMPVLERDGSYYGDSFRITEMLLQEYPDRAGRIYPGDPVHRAIVHAFVLSSEAWWLRPEGTHGTADYKRAKGAEHVQRILATDYHRRDALLHDWDAALAVQPFLTGDAYNMADIAVASGLNTRINIAKFAKQARESGMKTPFDPELWPLWDVDGARYRNLRRWFDECNTPRYTEAAVPAH